MCCKCSSFNGIEKYPKLRFPEFSEPWERVRIGDVYAERSERGAESAELLSVTMTEGVKRRSDIEGKDNSSEDKGNYKVVRIGDMVYNSMRMWQGANGISAYDGIVSPAYTVLTPKVEIANGFFGALFKTHRSISEFCRHSQGMTSDTWNLKYPQIETIRISMPVFKEQQKISEFLSKIEIRIEKQLDLVEHLKKYKRGVSKRFFDEVHNDQTCAVKQFSEVFELLQNNTFSRECLTDENTDVLNVHYGDILVKYGSVVDLDIDTVPFIKTGTDISKFSSSSYLQDGDVIFADTAEDYTVGKICEIINVSNRKILSGLHTMPFRPTLAFAPMYLGYYLNSAAFRTQILPMIQGAKVSSISKSEMKKTVMYIPNIEHQKEIVNVLSALDKRIKITELVLEGLKDMKQGLLQQLFI